MYTSKDPVFKLFKTMKDSRKNPEYEQNEIIERYKLLYAKQEKAKVVWTDEKE